MRVLARSVSTLLIATTLTTATLAPSTGRAGEQPDEGPTQAELLYRHKLASRISLPVMGLQLGLGLGLRAAEPDPDISVRQLHMVSALALTGIALYQLDTLLKLKPETVSRSHRVLSYSHMALLALTGVVGFVATHNIDNRSSQSARNLRNVHLGLATASAGTLIGAAFTLSFD